MYICDSVLGLTPSRIPVENIGSNFTNGLVAKTPSTIIALDPKPARSIYDIHTYIGVVGKRTGRGFPEVFSRATSKEQVKPPLGGAPCSTVNVDASSKNARYSHNRYLVHIYII